MSEIKPISIESLSKIEQYQAFRPERSESQDSVLALAWRIGTEPKLYRELIENPYSENATLTLSERFPDKPLSDAITAVILAEPEGIYDRRLKELTRDQRKEALSRQIDTSAEILMNLQGYVSQNLDTFWEMSDEDIYGELTTIAFRKWDIEQISRDYSQDQRRGTRLAVHNFIQDLHNLKVYKAKFETDPKNTLNELLEKDFEHNVEIESLPVGFIIYLEEEDYGKLDSVNEDNSSFQSNGKTLYWRSLPPEMIGRVVVMNKGGEKYGVKTQEDINKTREHELRHMIYASFISDQKSEYISDIEEALSKMPTSSSYDELSERLLKNQLSKAKNEVIAYYASGDISYRHLEDLDSELWSSHLGKIRDHLWMRKDLSSTQKVSIYRQFTDKYVQYLKNIKEYQWVAQKLFQEAHEQEIRRSSDGEQTPLIASESSGSPSETDLQTEQPKYELSTAKAEALLQTIPIEKAHRLASYFGVDPINVPKLLQDEQQTVVNMFIKSVDDVLSLLKNNSKSSAEEWSLWNEKFGSQKIDLIMTSYSTDVEPALLKIIEASNHQFLVNDSLYTLNLLLQVNHHTFSPGELAKIKTTLESMVTKRSDDDFKSVRRTAQIILKDIDEEYMPGGIDFIHNKPLGVEVAEIMKTRDDNDPTVEQITQVVTLLSTSRIEHSEWNKYIRVKHFKTLMSSSEGITALINMAKTVTNSEFVGYAIELLEKDFDSLSDEVKEAIPDLLDHVSSTSYEGTPKILADLNNAREKMIKRLQNTNN